jgi:O-antigen/teichoic acid export membrane protein
VWHLREALTMAKESLPFAYILIIGVVYYRFDGLMLTKLSTIAAVGAYGLAYRLAGQLTIIAPIVSNVLISRFAEDWAEDRAKFAATVRMALRLMTLVCVPIAVLCWPYADHAIRLIGSGEFVQSARHPLILLLVAVAFGMMSDVVSTALVVADQQNFLTRLNTTTLVVNVAVNAALIPAYGATGAGIALVCSEALGFFAAIWRTSTISESVVEWRSLGVTLALAGVAVAIGFALHGWPWPVSAAIVLAVYVLGQLATRNVPLATLRAIKSSA